MDDKTPTTPPTCEVCGKPMQRVRLFNGEWWECPESIIEALLPPFALVDILGPEHVWHNYPNPTAATYPHGCGGTYHRDEPFVEDRLNEELDGFKCDRCGRTCTREEAFDDAYKLMMSAKAAQPTTVFTEEGDARGEATRTPDND